MSRIQTTFERLAQQNKKALIPFITAGSPHPRHTVALMRTLVENGADIIELGVPFSDPMADGPVIQRASERALAHGVSLADVLDMVREFRATDADTPVVLMGYANPVEAMGSETFVARAAASGVDGVLTVDYPPEECGAFTDLLRRHGLDPIFLLSPTTALARAETIVAQASGFIYYVSLKGVTGSQHLDVSDVARHLEQLRRKTRLPIGVGFGIRDAATASRVADIADAVVIGSRLMQEMENSSEQNLLHNIATLTGELRRAMDAGQTGESA